MHVDRRSRYQTARAGKYFTAPGRHAVRQAEVTTRTSVREWNRQFRFVRVHHEHREELGRLRLTGIGADGVAVAWQLGEALPAS